MKINHISMVLRQLVAAVLLAVAVFTPSLSFAQGEPKAQKRILELYPDITPFNVREAYNVLAPGHMNAYAIFGARTDVSSFKLREAKADEPVTGKVAHIVCGPNMANIWDLEVNSKIVKPTLQGDRMLLSFWARCPQSLDESGSGFFDVYYQMGGPPWEKSIHVRVAAGQEWTHFTMPFESAMDFGIGGATMNFGMGISNQTIELANVELYDLGQFVPMSDLPITRFTYEGRESDAPWRAAAQKRIEENRMGDLTVIVRDKKGEPIPGATVRVKQTNHEFAFGNIVARELFASPTEKGEIYRKIIYENFNEVTMENALKYQGWTQMKKEGTTDRYVFQFFREMEARNIRVRGHVLVWPSSRYTDVRVYLNDKEALRKHLRDHIQEIVTATKGKVVDWDVVNEPFINHEFMDTLGYEELYKWFELADKYADPATKLYLNETHAIIDKGVNNAQLDLMAKYVNGVKERGLRIDGVGFQGHFTESGLTSMDRLMQIFDRFEKLGVHFKITEFDVATADNELQADYLRDLYTICFSHPACDGVISWGFWEGNHWRPDAAWYKKDWTPKPIAEMHHKMVYEVWNTDETTQADSDGQIKVKGFVGDYTIEVTDAKGKTQSFPGKLVKGGSRVEVQMK